MSAEQPSRPCGICAAIDLIKSGKVPGLIAELPHSYVVLGQAQFFRGYCILFAKTHATELHLMPPGEARALFAEVLAVGEAIARVVKPVKLNHECLGNLEPHIHWHVFPRFATEPKPKVSVWESPELLAKHTLDPADERELVAALQRELSAALRRNS